MAFDAASVIPATHLLYLPLLTQVANDGLVSPAFLPNAISCELLSPGLPSCGWFAKSKSWYFLKTVEVGMHAAALAALLEYPGGLELGSRKPSGW